MLFDDHLSLQMRIIGKVTDTSTTLPQNPPYFTMSQQCARWQTGTVAGRCSLHLFRRQYHLSRRKSRRLVLQQAGNSLRYHTFHRSAGGHSALCQAIV